MHRPERRDRLPNSLFARLLVCHICLDSRGDSAFCIDHVLCFLGPLEVVVYQGDLGTVSCEEDGSCSTVANLPFFGLESCGCIWVYVESLDCPGPL